MSLHGLSWTFRNGGEGEGRGRSIYQPERQASVRAQSLNQVCFLLDAGYMFLLSGDLYRIFVQSTVQAHFSASRHVWTLLLHDVNPSNGLNAPRETSNNKMGEVQPYDMWLFWPNVSVTHLTEPVCSGVSQKIWLIESNRNWSQLLSLSLNTLNVWESLTRTLLFRGASPVTQTWRGFDKQATTTWVRFIWKQWSICTEGHSPPRWRSDDCTKDLILELCLTRDYTAREV